MTDHILNFAIAIDDDAIIKSIQKNAEKQIINDIKKGLINTIFATGYYGNQSAVSINRYDDSISITQGAVLTEAAKEIVKNIMAEYKDEIIAAAAKELADSFKRTKKWKEKTEEVV